ncbi:LOW QUALITY PROTEIN: hypothetical protein PoB_001654600 [Plakobranchus ocellatus]|uniref:Uncharacterized protein n=1 Tax=Plakobranchus ocellatus TaxID=259542 RepID=A0AAV3Z627_9GAST|nr:LOW QUALITY PROTEIN: hypothetical protein PoB_001654600 [Plakobranchus ocellatus]
MWNQNPAKVLCDRLLTQPPVSKSGTKTQPKFCVITYSLSHPSQNVEPKPRLTQPSVSKCGTKTQPRSVCDRLLTQPPVSKFGTKTQPSHPSQNVEPKPSQGSVRSLTHSPIRLKLWNQNPAKALCDRLLTQPPVSKCGTNTNPRLCRSAYSLSHASPNVEPKPSQSLCVIAYSPSHPAQSVEPKPSQGCAAVNGSIQAMALASLYSIHPFIYSLIHTVTVIHLSLFPQNWHSLNTRGIGSTAACESALRSAATLLSWVRALQSGP